MQGQPMGYGALGQMGAAQLMNQQQLQQLSQLQQHMGQIPGMTGYQMTGMAGLGGTSVSMAPPQQQMGPNGSATALAGLFYPQRPGEKECEFFMKTGTCKFGSTCKFHHPSDLKHVVLPATSFTGGLDGEQHPRRPGNPCCPHFSKTATCKFGQTCKFDHPPESVHQLIAMTATNGEHPRRPGEPACSYFMRTGTCKYGPTCRFDHPQRRDGAGYGGGPGKMGGPMGANPYMTNAYGGGGAGGFDRFNDRMRPRFPDRPKFPGTFRNYGSSGGSKDATGGNTHWILADKDSGSEEEQPSVLFTSYDELQRYAANAKDVMIFSGTSEEDVKNKAGPLGKYVVAAPNSNKRGREEEEVDATDGGPLLKRLREALNKPSPYVGLVQCPLCPVPRIVKFKAMSLEEMWTFEVSGDKPEEAFNSPDLLAHMKEKHNEVLSLATGKDWPSVSSVMFDVAAIHLSRKTEPLDGWPLVFDDSLFGHVRRLVDAWCAPSRRTEKVWQDGGVCRRVKAIVGPDEESEEVVTIRDRLREMARKYSDKAWEDDQKANGKGEDQATNTGAYANAMKEEPEDTAEITYPVYANGALEGEAEEPVEETLVAVAETA